MFRVTRCDAPDEIETLRVEGRLTRSELPRFHDTCADLLASGRLLSLDLSGLQFADRDAVAALQALRSRGVSLVGTSGFVDALLADSSR